MQEVMFMWADGPAANRASRYLWVFSPEGKLIDPRKESAFHRTNGKWSYTDWRVYVPLGAYILESSSNTHGYASKKMWLAVEGRPVVYKAHSTWSEMATWSVAEELSQEFFRKMLAQVVRTDIQEQWSKNENILSI